MSFCSQVITQLQNIHSQHQKLNQQVDGFVELKNSKVSTQVENEYLLGLYQSRKELSKLIKELKKEFFNPIIETKNYITVEGRPTQETEIRIDFEATINKAKTFYQKHEINLPPDFEVKAKEIWRKNYEAIQKEIATYGYDDVLIIPDNLPSLAELHAKMVDGYAEKSYMKEHLQDGSMLEDNFLKGGSFTAVKNSKKKDSNFHLTLIHDIEDCQDTKTREFNSPFQNLLLATKNMYPDELTRLSNAEIETIIADQGELFVNVELSNIKFGADKLVQNNILYAEGLTLVEYLIFQRKYFEEHGGYLDNRLYVWLLASSLGKRFIVAHLPQMYTILNIDALDIHPHYAGCICRPSRSFTL